MPERAVVLVSVTALGATPDRARAAVFVVERRALPETFTLFVEAHGVNRTG